MCNVLCVTNRRLCASDFKTRVLELLSNGAFGVILREKDLGEEEYFALACEIVENCRKMGFGENGLIIHNYPKVAQKLNLKAFHGPLAVVEGMTRSERAVFNILGASCHSIEDALKAEALGCTYVTAGHVFETDCKAGLAGRGLGFLENVCKSVKIPVFAIGGITADNAKAALDCGAFGVAVMSACMKCDNVTEFLEVFKNL